MRKHLGTLCAIFFFSATAANLLRGVTLPTALSFLSGSFFILDHGFTLLERRPKPIRYPKPGGIKRFQEHLKELRSRPPSEELVGLLSKVKRPKRRRKKWTT